mmetsp:Transcript_12248/g.38790  ORF Transcript_12248/g.38790 Transcript_12248/m.38790 type:complete len:207 (-) Transcript_12248:1492-2112(-)
MVLHRLVGGAGGPFAFDDPILPLPPQLDELLDRLRELHCGEAAPYLLPQVRVEPRAVVLSQPAEGLGNLEELGRISGVRLGRGRGVQLLAGGLRLPLEAREYFERVHLFRPPLEEARVELAVHGEGAHVAIQVAQHVERVLDAVERRVRDLRSAHVDGGDFENLGEVMDRRLVVALGGVGLGDHHEAVGCLLLAAAGQRLEAVLDH